MRAEAKQAAASGGWMALMHARAERVGAAALRLAAEARRLRRLLLAVIAAGVRLRWPRRIAVMNVLIRQVYFTGVQGLPWVAVMAVGIGAVAVFNIVAFAKSLQDLSLVGRMVSGLLVGEAAPLFVAVFLLARSGVAVVTEIGAMHVRGEDMTLASMGVDVAEYLYLPRLLAFALCGLILTFLFVALAIWFGGLVAAWTQEMNFIDFLVEVRRGTSFGELALLFGKGLLYPTGCALMLLGQGCMVGRDPNMIPVRATRGVLGALMFVLFADALLAVAL